MREIKHSGVEKFVRNGKEGSQRKKKNLVVMVENRFSATQYLLTANVSSVLISTNLQYQREEKRKEKTQNIIHMINPNRCMCRAEHTSDSTGNHKPTPVKEIQLDLLKISFVLSSRYQKENQNLWM